MVMWLIYINLFYTDICVISVQNKSGSNEYIRTSFCQIKTNIITDAHKCDAL